MHWDANKIIRALPFYNTYIEKPEVKKLNNVELLKELPFYDELSVVKNKKNYLVYLSNQCSNDSMDLLLISNDFTSHYVYIKDFNRLMFNKAKIKTRNTFLKVVYSVLIMKMF